jgi:hypothetical protein
MGRLGISERRYSAAVELGSERERSRRGAPFGVWRERPGVYWDRSCLKFIKQAVFSLYRMVGNRRKKDR